MCFCGCRAGEYACNAGLACLGNIVGGLEGGVDGCLQYIGMNSIQDCCQVKAGRRRRRLGNLDTNFIIWRR
eukprot:3314193-Ditylum_brightwellii.AAC.1